jgi:hypothetical protein
MTWIQLSLANYMYIPVTKYITQESATSFLYTLCLLPTIHFQIFPVYPFLSLVCNFSHYVEL